MQKTKLGLSVGIVAALAYFCGLMGLYLYIALIIIAGYVLLKEEDKWLKYSVVKTIALAAVFDVIIAILGIIPDFLDWLNSCITLGNGYFNYAAVSAVFGIIINALRIVKTILFIILIFAALKQNTINIPIVDDLITKNNFFGAAPQQNAPQQPQYQAQGQPQFYNAPQQNPNQFQQAPSQPYQNQVPNQGPQNNGQN